MKEKTFTIVTTTINAPILLETYANDAKKFNRKINEFIVIGDKKTPIEAEYFCNSMLEKTGVKCFYFSPETQEKYLEKFGEIKNFVPWNCIQRRNVGLLLAYESISDIVITIDDDNFLHEDDYLGHHSHLGEIIEVPAVSSRNGWWNVCEMLTDEKGINFYHRGYPLSKRWLKDESVSISNVKKRIVVNAGLWLDDPDVDALTRLYFPVKAIGPSEKYQSRIATEAGTWSPFNSQNTALLRETIPAYFLFPHIGRYDDIWASYIFRHIADYFDDLVTYGSPLVVQKRNPHNYFKDFDAERFGLECNDVFIETVKACKLNATNYQEAYLQIAQQFPQIIIEKCLEKKMDANLFIKVIEGMKIWSNIFSR
jgi:hypothetical protein